MRILQLCHKNPFPAKDGGCLAISAITKGFIENGVELHTLIMRTEKHYSDASAWPDEYRSKANIVLVDVDTSVSIVSALKSLVNRTSYNLARFYSKAYELQLIQLLQRYSFDVIHIESLFACLYTPVIRKHSKARIVYRSHNVESQIWERLSLGSKSFMKRWYLNELASRLKRFEKQDINNYDLILAITEGDRLWYMKHGAKEKKVITVPFGVDMINYPDHTPSAPVNTVCFIGSLDWMPNVQGVNWFLNDVWPRVTDKIPAAQFFLAGRNMPEQFKKVSIKGYTAVGEVESAVDFFAPKSIMVIPLLTGGGMRVKIIEAMAVGKAVVSTSIGAENIDVVNGIDMIVEDDPQKFADAIVSLLNNHDCIRQIGAAARSVIEKKYDNKVISQDLIDTYKQF